MKLTKFGILVNKTTSLFTSIRDSKISRGCLKILENLEGREGKFWGPILENPEGRGGHMANPFRGGGVWKFSGTTHLHVFFRRRSSFCSGQFGHARNSFSVYSMYGRVQ